MSNDYEAGLWFGQHMAELRADAEQERLAHLVRSVQPRRRWWERLMLSRRAGTPSQPQRQAEPAAGQPAVVAGDVNC